MRIISLWPLEASRLPETFQVIEQTQRLAFSSSVFLLKALLEKEMIDSRLFLVTERTQLLNACDNSPKPKSVPWVLQSGD